uniref:RING-type domain-containing protein n=1 Tax=Nothobranchius furzeri TaxID=105023 RepID=A0A8C6K7L0_NOTFU
MGSSTSLPQGKCYGPKDSTLMIVEEEDVLDLLCEDFPSRRAQMSCGHSVTPTSLTNWCRGQLEDGKSRFACAQFGCEAEWSMQEVCRMALLTSHLPYILKLLRMLINPSLFFSSQCPDCKSPVARHRETDLCVSCQVCTAKKGRPKPHSDRCNNDKCCNSALETLNFCPTIMVGSVVCSSVRACPVCGSLLKHDGIGCRNTTCPKCKLRFRYVCLETSECYKTNRIYSLWSSGVAPRETSIPVWNRK